MNMSVNQEEPVEQDATGSDFRKAVAFVYIGLIWIFSFVIMGWIIQQKLDKIHFFHSHEIDSAGESHAEPEGQAEAESEGQAEVEAEG